MTTITRPPLPEPQDGPNYHTGGFALFNADQMRAYGAACAAAERERCAKVCRDFDATDSLSNYGLVLARMIDDLEVRHD